MPRKEYEVTIRRKADGAEVKKRIFAENEAVARERAPDLARRGLEAMADREYAEFEVLGCTVLS
ncbi:aspartate/glutamate racemase [Bradyrhizobium sp. i1.8.4]|uniref:hypothetical protein n=1 Tax=unclassified Bradyrhizobium TaxID=2631580 RepID=UPI003D2474BF